MGKSYRRLVLNYQVFVLTIISRVKRFNKFKTSVIVIAKSKWQKKNFFRVVEDLF